MGWYRVTYLFLVIDDLRETEIVMAQCLFDKSRWLASNAENFRHEPLDQDVPGLAQYPVGDWRILYSIDREDQRRGHPSDWDSWGPIRKPLGA